MQLTIIGTVHLDPLGVDLLKKALDEIRPEYITLDVSNYAINFRQNLAEDFMARLAPFRRADGMLPASLENVEAQIAIPFEVRAVDEWCKTYALIGNNNDSRIHLKLFERELMSPENLAYLSSESSLSLCTQVSRQWEKARASWRKLCAATPCDERITTILKRLLSQSGKSLCHITGWEHLASLGALMADYRPALRLLDEFRPSRQPSTGLSSSV